MRQDHRIGQSTTAGYLRGAVTQIQAGFHDVSPESRMVTVTCTCAAPSAGYTRSPLRIRNAPSAKNMLKSGTPRGTDAQH